MVHFAKTIELSPGFARAKTKGRGALRSARSSCIDRSSPPDHPAPYDTRLGGSEAWHSEWQQRARARCCW